MKPIKTNIITVDGDGNVVLQDVTIHGQINIMTSSQEEIKVFLDNHSEEQLAALRKLIEPLNAVTFENKQKVIEIDTKVDKNAKEIERAKEDSLKNSGKKIEKEIWRPVANYFEEGANVTAKTAKGLGKESENVAKEVAKITKKGAKETANFAKNVGKESEKVAKKVANETEKLAKKAKKIWKKW